MKRIRSAATPFLSEVDVSNVAKLTGQMNCLHINSDLRFVSNVFFHRKKLLRRGPEGTVDIFHCSQKFNEQEITFVLIHNRYHH